MSQGQDTQTNLNILTGLTLAAGVAMVLVLAVTMRTSTLSLGLLGVVIILGTISIFVARCRACRHDVTKDAEGRRVHKGWPRVNEICAKCGAEIP